MTERSRPTLADAIAVLPEECYENPTWKGVLWLMRDLAMYALLVASLVSSDHPLILVLLWPLTGLAIAGLFILGHDAAHGALFKSARLNYLLGQLAMLPALHLYDAWVYGHNRIHHGHTTRDSMDYVWHPVTPERYAALSRWEKFMHRLSWSWLGGGIYYLREIWWRGMIRFTPPAKIRDKLRRDRIVVGSYAALASAALLALGYASGESLGSAVWIWTKVFAVPFLLWNYAIGMAVYVHHIAPDITWRKRRNWTKFAGQVEGTTVLHVSRFINFFMHNIFLHVPHHVDMRIPFYGLPRAVEALREHFSSDLREREYSLGDYLRTTRACKLFDFEKGVWRDYRGQVAA